METISRVIVSLVYYNSLVRDTLEYTLNKPDGFDTKYYDYKRNGIVNEIKLNTPLKVFLDQNGEKGEDLRKRLEAFGNEFYSDASTVIVRKNEELRIDHAQNVKIFQNVIPLHEELNSIIQLHVNHARTNNILEEKVANLVSADERFYRAVAFLTLNGEIDRQFEEFNKVMRESKGEATPQSNFIQNDLNELVKCIATVRQHATCKDELYTNALDAIFASIEMMNGKRDLPKGKTFADVFNDCNQKIAAFVQDAEKAWRDTYTPCLNELIEDTRSRQENQAEKPEVKPE